MSKIIELKIKNPKEIYKELTKILEPYKKEPQGSILFIVEGTKEAPIIGIRYPGKKLKRRNLRIVRNNSALWANLYDFEVVPFRNGKELGTQEFTFEKIMRDFQENKKDNEEFWYALNEVYENNIIPKELPKLPGIDTRLYLSILKWIWIQEDFNYRFKWDEVGSLARYVLETRTGTTTSGGAGRAKSFAALILLRYYFSFDQVKKIIPLY